MAFVIVSLDMLHINCSVDTRLLIEIAQVIRQIRIIGNPANITFEVAKIDRIKPDQGSEQTPICFGNLHTG